MKIYMETCMFLCFYVHNLHESMKTELSCIFSILVLIFTPLHHNDKGSIIMTLDQMLLSAT